MPRRTVPCLSWNVVSSVVLDIYIKRKRKVFSGRDGTAGKVGKVGKMMLVYYCYLYSSLTQLRHRYLDRAGCLTVVANERCARGVDSAWRVQRAMVRFNGARHAHG